MLIWWLFTIILPDIIAPGVDILAAYSPFGVIHVDPLFKRLGNFTILSGTFVSCPHAAGVAAYVKSFHPDWSPSAIQSAIMTTGNLIFYHQNIIWSDNLIWKLAFLNHQILSMKFSKNKDAEFAFGLGISIMLKL